MKYFKRYREEQAEPFEVSKDEARRTLDGWWKEEVIEDIFCNDIPFRLYTPYSEVWTIEAEKEFGLQPTLMGGVSFKE